jgi:predicted kinase
MAATPDRPLLVIVDGSPASGKTTIARSIAEALSLPMLSKDVIKDALFDTLGVGDRDWSRKVGIASVDVILRLAAQELRSARGVILESTLDPRFELAPLRAIIADHPAIVVQVYCSAPVEMVVRRSLDRAASGERNAGHVDQADADGLREAVTSDRWPPLELPGTLIRFDTTSFADARVESLVTEIMRIREEGGGSSNRNRPSSATEQPDPTPAGDGVSR